MPATIRLNPYNPIKTKPQRLGLVLGVWANGSDQPAVVDALPTGNQVPSKFIVMSVDSNFHKHNPELSKNLDQWTETHVYGEWYEL